MHKRVLVVDDDQSMCELAQAGLSRHGYEVSWETSGEAARHRLEDEPLDVVITDINLHRMSGLELCEWVVANRSDLPVIVITAFGSMETAIGAIRVGAYDFITKPLDIEQLALALDRAVQHRDLREEVRRLRLAAKEASRVENVVGDSQAIRKIFGIIQRLANSDVSVLITGESGTGKELVARALHSSGATASGPFTAINCAAMPANLLESELFGHVRGAFTDAKQTREGLFMQANGGTLFLDEIAEMPLEMQPKLLRTLQESKVRPVGANHEVSFRARVIAATNRDLEADVEMGRFREDLFYRINVVQIHVPPLRVRGNDVLLLAQYFLDRVRERTGKDVKGLSSAAAQKLLDYEWPGNVRELQNCIERAVTLTEFDLVTVEDLPQKIRNYQSTQMVINEDPEQMLSLDELERRYIVRVLKAVEGNKTQAARILGLDRRTLYRKLERQDKRNGQESSTVSVRAV